MKIAYNVSINNINRYISEDIIFIRNKSDYNYFKENYPDKIVEYVPDTKFLLWQNDIIEDKTSTILSILIPQSDIPTKLKNIINKISIQYFINYYDENNLTDEDIREIVGKSDLVICQNYISHLACIIHEKPFISFLPDSETITLLKDIKIGKLRFDKCKQISYLLNNWIEYRKLIQEYKKQCLKYIKFKFNKYNIEYG